MERRPPDWAQVERNRLRIRQPTAQRHDAASAAGDLARCVGYLIAFAIIVVIADHVFDLVYQSWKTGFSPLP